MPAVPNIITRANYTSQQTPPANRNPLGWGYYASASDLPAPSDYGTGYAFAGGSLYWCNGSSWTGIGGGSSGPVYALTSAAGGVNVATWDVGHSGYNSVDSATKSVSIFGGANGGQCNGGANAVGKDIPANVDLSNPSDTYVAGTADYSQTMGYDNMSNGLMSVSLGAHNLIYTACDHAFIFGARCRIESGSRNTIIGHSSKIYGGTSYNCILGGISSYINADSTHNYNTLIGGNNSNINNASASFDLMLGSSASSITSSGSYNIALGAATGTISGSGSYGMILGGTTNTVSANKGRVLGGSGNTASNVDATTIGSNCTASGQNSIAIGESVKADAHGQLSLSGRVNAAAGDAQTDILNMSVQTTSNTDTTTKTAGANGANVAAGAYCGEVYVIARKSDGTAASGFIIPFVFEKVGTTVTVRKGQTRTDTTVLYDGLGITSANAPYIASASTYFSVTVQGLAATTINWSCSVRMARVV